jgi:hypothetical protein
MIVDHRHEADRLVGTHHFDDLIADHHLDDAGLHNVHALASVALVEHDCARLKADCGARAARELAHVDVFDHFLPLKYQRIFKFPCQTRSSNLADGSQ